MDRRMVRERIASLKQELVLVRSHRATQRKERSRIPLPHAAIVGYTNAGKSSLLRTLTGSDVYVANKLFATLDTTTRRIELPNGRPLLMTDTVGFVRRLPHRLVESFKATLEEAVLSDFLVHVLDINAPEVEAFHHTTLEVLKELGADQKRIITVFNKIDLLEDDTKTAAVRAHHPDAVFVSAHTGEGLDTLRDRMADLLADQIAHMRLKIPHERADIVARLHQHGHVNECRYEDDAVYLDTTLPKRLAEEVREWSVG